MKNCCVSKVCRMAAGFLARPLLLKLAVALYCLMGPNHSHAETWAERLGFPAEKKVVILHAHDLGLCYETNAAAEKLLVGGVVQSASAMAPCPWFANSAAWAGQNSRLDIGLQLTLNSELSEYRWKPMAPHGLATSLVDSKGYFWPKVLQTTVSGDAADVEHELESQLQQARLAGLNPSHFTTHLGALFSRHDFAEAYLRFSQRHWIPAVVVELTPQRIESFRNQGFPLPNDLLQLVDSYRLPKVDDLKFLPTAETAEEKRRLTMELFASLSTGLTQIAAAPAVHSQALERIDTRWQQRVWEMELLSDPKLKEQLQAENVIFTNWREIMDRFHGP